MKLTVEQIQQLSWSDVPSWEEIEQMLIQLDDESLRALNELAMRIQSACSSEDEARSEGTSKRKDC